MTGAYTPATVEQTLELGSGTWFGLKFDDDLDGHVGLLQIQYSAFREPMAVL